MTYEITIKMTITAKERDMNDIKANLNDHDVTMMCYEMIEEAHHEDAKVDSKVTVTSTLK